MTKTIYLVGGAVRDIVMGLVPKDRDYVAVGYTEKEFLDMKYQRVGADFPVFLHPETGEEYALARREKKTGTGYLGFTSEFGADVTLEEDLSRRDLSINSIALNYVEYENSYERKIYDPFNGMKDIQNKILRHTSDAFREDPVRVLRLARLRARFGSEWKVAHETQAMISMMAKTGVLKELTAERVWKELSRALMETHPRIFFDTLLECDALHVIFPEIYRLKTALEAYRWHPEGDAYEHTMLVLTQASKMAYDLDTRIACLCHDFGKGLTPRDQLPRHYGHDVNGVSVVEQFCNRLTIPTKIRDVAMAACRYHMNMHKLFDLNSKTFVKMFDDMSAKNDPRKIRVLYEVGVCDHRGRLGSENSGIDHLQYFIDVFDAVQSVKFADVFPNGETNVNKIKQALFNAKVNSIKSMGVKVYE